MTYPGQGWPGQPQDPQGQPPAGWPQQPGQPAEGWQQQPAQPTGGWQQPTQPGEGWQQQPAPGWQQQPAEGWQQQPAGLPQQPQQPQDQQGQPAPGWQPYQQPGAYPGQQYPQVQYPAGYGAPAQPKRRRGLLIGVVVAVVVAAGGGVGTWFAFDHASSAGSATPQLAAAKLVADVGNDDLLGIVNDLPPAEAALLRDTIQGTTDQLKRLQVIKPDASAQSATGLTVHTSGIRFDDGAAERVNDHLTITKLVAGTITLNQSVSTNAYTDTFLHGAFPDGTPGAKTHTVDIASTVRELGHPIRIATVQVNGTWYPSLFYSIADAGLQAAHENWPSQSVPAVGAASADAAVRQFVQAALDADIRGVIERTAPDEMGALHDAGQALIEAAGAGEPSGMKIDDMTFADRTVPGGVDAVLRSLTLSGNSDRIEITQSGGCYSVSDEAAGEHQRFCASDLTQQIEQGSDFLPPAFLKFLKDMLTGVMNNGVGIVASQVGGQWYVSPGRTLSQLVMDMYGSVTPDDIAALLQGSH